MRKPLRLLSLSSKSMPQIGLKILRGTEPKRESHGLELGPRLRKQFLLDNYMHELFLR